MDYRPCACCTNNTIPADSKYFDFCPVCNWQDDPIQNDDPDYDGGANHISLNEAKRAFAAGKALRPLKRAAFERQGRTLDESIPALAKVLMV
ncbi:CPCC family cysteine-rich protein [Breznakiellaceae bacterium SP9]